VISHEHTDHFDEDMLALFKPDNQIIIANFNHATLYQRLQKMGFTNLIQIDDTGLALDNGIHVRALVTQNPVHEDAIFTFDTQDGLIIHANDHWFAWPEASYAAVREQVSHYKPHQVTLFGQAHSATGYPLNAKALTDAEKKTKVFEIAQHMLHEELKSAAQLGVSRFVSYAGFIAPYVADFDHYRDLVLIPSAQQMQRLADAQPAIQTLLERIDILEFYPQDVLDVATGHIRKAFISSQHYSDAQIKQAGSRFYKHYQVIQATNTYAPATTALQESELNQFVKTMAHFLNQHFAKLDPAHAAKAKTFQLVIPNMNQTRYLTIGEPNVGCQTSATADLTLEVKADLLAKTIRKQMSFENLYTGFVGLWSFATSKQDCSDLLNGLMIFAHHYQYRDQL
ncbi:MAG: hypothetical protein ISP86_01565, partial [Shewanellaceae bacterium]|nr:hypothetical protein [Shewanellaceae bacterium]